MATKTLLLMVTRLAGRKVVNEVKMVGKQKIIESCVRTLVMARYIGTLLIYLSSAPSVSNFLDILSMNTILKTKKSQTKTVHENYSNDVPLLKCTKKKTLKSLIIFITFLNSLSTAKPDQ